MKIALCFIISYEHILNKEDIWKEWIEYNKDIINVYFYYKDIKKIKSPWILKHTIPPSYIYDTSYYHVVPAYLSIMKFAFNNDEQNQWFCMLTESCCPIISPKKFRYMFYKNYMKSVISYKNAWWNIKFHKRANLYKLPVELHLANDPWFIMKREHVKMSIDFSKNYLEILKIVCAGGLANESIFAIILKTYNQIDKNNIICEPTHICDWFKTTNSTSPHLFKYADEYDIKVIDHSLKKYKNPIFIRKIDREFPDQILRHYIYENTTEDDALDLTEPSEFKKIHQYESIKNLLYKIISSIILLCAFYLLVY